MSRTPRVLGSLLLFAAANDLQAGSASASFGISITIVRPCTIRAKDARLLEVVWKVSCAANGSAPMVEIDQHRLPPQAVVTDAKAKVVTITY